VTASAPKGQPGPGAVEPSHPNSLRPMSEERSSDLRAVRVRVTGPAASRGREEEVARAEHLGLLGWTREDDGEVRIHAEGDAGAVDELLAWLAHDRDPAGLEIEEVDPEGHEQFAVRGVAAGRFEVIEGGGGRGGWELRLEVGREIRRWAVPRGPSVDPADKRMAVQLDPEAGGIGAGDAWDRGTYEQGGRVPWPEALGRGHAVFVLHGGRLEGGFALQRTGGGPRAKWLLIKRRDEHATRQPGAGDASR
jgi:acylphosphatase